MSWPHHSQAHPVSDNHRITVINERPSSDLLDQSERCWRPTQKWMWRNKTGSEAWLVAHWRYWCQVQAAQLGELLPGDINARRPWEAVSQWESKSGESWPIGAECWLWLANDSSISPSWTGTPGSWSVTNKNNISQERKWRWGKDSSEMCQDNHTSSEITNLQWIIVHYGELEGIIYTFTISLFVDSCVRWLIVNSFHLWFCLTQTIIQESAPSGRLSPSGSITGSLGFLWTLQFTPPSPESSL